MNTPLLNWFTLHKKKCQWQSITHSHSYFLKIKTTQGSRACTSVLFRKTMLNLKRFFSERCEESTKGTFEGYLGCGSWVTLWGMEKIVEKLISRK